MPSTAAPLPASANFGLLSDSSQFKDYRHRHGAAVEEIVIRDFADRGFKLRARRYRTPYAEIDLLFFHVRSGWWLVEVKAAAQAFAAEDLLSSSQSQRLRRAAAYIASQVGQFPRCILACVSESGDIDLLPFE